jgi:hypothetical protein
LEAEQQEPEKTEEEKFSFPPGSSLTALERERRSSPTPEPEYYPSPTAPAYNPADYDNSRVKISLATEVCAERSVRHVFRSGAKRKPTLTLPQDWADAMSLDLANKDNGHDILMAELSADRTEIRLKKMEPPPGMRAPVTDAPVTAVDNILVPVDSDAAAQAAEAEEK